MVADKRTAETNELSHHYGIINSLRERFLQAQEKLAGLTNEGPSSSITTAASSDDLLSEFLPSDIRGRSDPFEDAEDLTSPILPIVFQQSTAECNATIPNTTIIIDWDDTLFPSSWIQKLDCLFPDDPASPSYRFDAYNFDLLTGGDEELKDYQLEYLRQIEHSSLQLLDQCAKYGDVLIITNAEKGWVQMSSSRFLPQLYQYMMANKIPIISARSSFSSYHDSLTSNNDPDLWKLLTFTDILKSNFSQSRTHAENAAGCPTRTQIISIGDSESERRALLSCRQKFYSPGCFFKSVKLIDTPHASLLVRQHQFLSQTIARIVSVPDCVDLVFSLPTSRT